MAFCTLIFTFLFVPECTGKSLEEIDLMFLEYVPLRGFGNYKAGAKIQKEKGVLEDGKEV